MSAAAGWLAFSLTAVLIVWLFRRDARRRRAEWDTASEARAEAKRLQASHTAVMASQAAERRAYIESLRPEWPFTTYCKINGRHADLLLSADASKMLFLLGLGGAPTSGGATYELATSSLTEIRLERRTTTRSATRVEEVLVPQANRKSTVGRALVGGVLLGPVGAAVGAASSMKGAPPKLEKRTVVDNIVEENAPLIVLLTRDLARPVLKLDLIGKDRTDEWYARLLSATR